MIDYIIININVQLLLLYNYTNHVSLNHSLAYLIFNDSSQRVTTITAELLVESNESIYPVRQDLSVDIAANTSLLISSHDIHVLCLMFKNLHFSGQAAVISTFVMSRNGKYK